MFVFAAWILSWDPVLRDIVQIWNPSGIRTHGPDTGISVIQTRVGFRPMLGYKDKRHSDSDPDVKH